MPLEDYGLWQHYLAFLGFSEDEILKKNIPEKNYLLFDNGKN